MIFSKRLLKILFIILLGVQYNILMIIYSNILEIEIIKLILLSLPFIIVAIMQTELFPYLKKVSLDTIFFMNTTLFAFCLNQKGNIYNHFIKESFNNLNKKINGY